MAGGDKKNFVIGSHSPYFLHPFEGLRMMIPAVVFDGKNYELWQNAVRTILKEKINWGSLKEP